MRTSCRKSARSIRGEAHDDHVVRSAGKDLPGETHAIAGVSHGGGRGVEVELAMVTLSFCGFRKLQHQIADGLIGHLAERFGHHLRPDQSGRLAELAFIDEFPHFGERCLGLGIHWIVRSAGPDRAFVELDALVHCLAEDHRSELAVTDGNGLLPLLRRLVPP